MALKIWLPLNGSLENKGISDVTVTNNGATVDNNGKIGKCYSFNGSSSYLLGTPAQLNNNSTEWSFACWFKPNSAHNGCLFSNRTSASATGITIFYYTNQILIDDGVRWQFTPSTAVTVGAWNHIAVIRKANGYKQLYLNGILTDTITTTGTPTVANSTHFSIGASQSSSTAISGNYFNGYINDVRIYDHCLSPLEVKEISQGLVLHYKLDNQYSESTVNYLTGKSEDFVGKWGSYGFGSRGTLTDGGIAPALSGQAVLVTNNAADTTNVATELATTFNSNQTTIMNKGESFTASCYVKGNGTTIGKRIHIHLYNTNGTNTLSTGKDYTLTNEWQRITYTLTWTYDTASTNSGNCYVVGYISTGESFYVSNWQVEKKDHVTPYTSTSRDGEIIDSSGYGNDGDIIGELSVESGSSRYTSAIHIGSTSSKIHILNFPTAGFGNSYTFAWWAKVSSVNPMHWGFSDGIRLNGMYTGRLWNTGDGSNNPLYTPGTTTQVTAPTVNVWHHWVMTGDGTSCKVYQDGVYWGVAKTYKSISGTSIYINGWNSGTDYCSDNLSISDFRIYATALSAEDILDLYHTSASVDNLGGLHGFELEEKNGNMLAGSPLVAGSGATMTWDEANDYYIINSPTSTSTWGIGPAVGTSPKKLIPWGMSYRLTFEVYTPTAATWYIDYNNNDVNTTLSGNDNDSDRLTTGVSVPANQWTLVTYGCSNTNGTKNPDHLTLYDYSTGIGPVMTNISSPITWYMRNPQWYLVDTDNSTSYQAKKNGQFKGNFFKQDSLLDRASWRNNEKAIWATEFIEK